MSETPTGGLGERRRRREAERSRAKAARAEEPMSRRERRALEEGLASGAIRLTDSGYEPTGEIPTTTSGQHALTPEQVPEERPDVDSGEVTEPGSDEPESDGGAQADVEAEPDDDAEPDEEPALDEAERDDEAAPDDEARPDDEAERDDEESDAELESDGPGHDEEPEPEPEPEHETEETPESPSGRRTVSRRSLRQQRAAADAEGTSPEEPSEQTGTGRRPVIRPPAAARGVRGIDATGELTGIQRAVRDIDAAPDAPSTSEPTAAHEGDAGTPSDTGDTGDAATPAEHPETVESSASPTDATTAWDSGNSPTYRVLLDGAPLPTTRTEAAPADESTDHAEATSAVGDQQDGHDGTANQEDQSEASAEDAAETPAAPEPGDEPDDSFDMRPRWPSLAGVETGEHPILRMDPEDEDSLSDAENHDEDEEDEKHTPVWLAALYILVLVLAAGVLALLVWRMATGDLFDEEGGAAALAVSSWLGIANT